MQSLTKARLVCRYIASFPTIWQKLTHYQQPAATLPDELRVQAHASLRQKAFHCIGGAIYSLYPGVHRQTMQEAIVALQTISDYLDNLCDRVQINDDRAFRQLHVSFTDALTLDGKVHDYYKYYPFQETNYLQSLVTACQKQIKTMPYYQQNQPYILTLANYYCELQSLKHLTPDGAIRLQQWIQQSFPGEKLAWNEWAAATGSTLGIFMLFAASYHNYSLSTIEQIQEAYLPWIQGVHILLDYFIDQKEDQIHGDLNFVVYHKDLEDSTRRIRYMITEGKKQIKHLPNPGFHSLVIQGLIAMYGSDPKVKRTGLLKSFKDILAVDSTAMTLWQCCLVLRKCKRLR